jgi:hypothetical protein
MTPFMVPTKASLRPKSVVKVMRFACMAMGKQFNGKAVQRKDGRSPLIARLEQDAIR